MDYYMYSYDMSGMEPQRHSTSPPRSSASLSGTGQNRTMPMYPMPVSSLLGGFSSVCYQIQPSYSTNTDNTGWLNACTIHPSPALLVVCIVYVLKHLYAYINTKTAATPSRSI
ncbi:unnamed protein product [Periconia digitata]|uniref:Uncharacterized protein n=1 Tax=Periconia digitata TaxID=1303443 RepID=A0A9W4UWX2_9PLEO|nr:unnamed protein product [Periconia digitata]